MKEMTFLCKAISHVNEIAEQIFKECLKLNIKKLIFVGELGSGKTTFIKALCNLSGYQGIVDSPTFTIVNEYAINKDKIIYHIDLYRLKTIEEALDIGIVDIIDKQDDYVFIEWPELILEILPDDFAMLSINVINASERKIKLKFLK